MIDPRLFRYGFQRLFVKWAKQRAINEAFAAPFTPVRSQEDPYKTIYNYMFKPKEETTMTLEDAMIVARYGYFHGSSPSARHKLSEEAYAMLRKRAEELMLQAERNAPERVLVDIQVYPDRPPGMISSWYWIRRRFSDGTVEKTRADSAQALAVKEAFDQGKAAGARGG